MLAPRITTHLADATSRLAQQYQGYPGITGLLQAVCLDIQNIENAFYALDAGRQIITPPVGLQLDNLGTLLGPARNGLSDAAYLALLLGSIAEDHSDGSAPALLHVAQTLYQATSVFLKTPNSPGQVGKPRHAVVALGVGSPQSTAASQSLIQQLLTNSIAAGVGLFYISSFNATGAFAMAGPQAWTNNGTPTSSSGFGDALNANVGGGYASLLYTNPGL